MDTKQIKYELQNLISGKSGASYDALIQTVASHLRSGKRTSPMAEEKHQNKAQETEKLIEFAKSNNLIIENIPEEQFNIQAHSSGLIGKLPSVHGMLYNLLKMLS